MIPKQQFYEILFDEGDMVCWGVDPLVTDLEPLRLYERTHAQYVCINPLKNKRNDINVTKLRNILVEFDTGTIEEQLKTIKASKLPYSTLVLSGNKSVHAIVSLKEPLNTIDEYKALAQRIYNKMGGKAVVDTKCGNPSRFSRTPNVKRDNGNLQEFIALDGRISREALEDWLGPEPEKPKTEQRIETGLPSRWTKYFLAFGAADGDWNNQLFRAACDLTRCGYSLEEIIEKCEGVTGTLDASDRRTIKSAFSKNRA